MRIVVTGASGRIGRAVMPWLGARHEVVGIDIRAPRRGPVIRGDLRRRSRPWSPLIFADRRSRWERALDGADAVLHLAGAVSPRASWPDVLTSNIDATWNVLEAAAECGVGRVVFASSIWPVRKVLEERGREGLPEDPHMLRPTGPYGLSKGVGELTGRMFVDTGRLRAFVAVRIGIFHRKTPKADPYGLHVRPGPLCDVLQECLEGELEGYHLRYAIGAGPARGTSADAQAELSRSEPQVSVLSS